MSDLPQRLRAKASYFAWRVTEAQEPEEIEALAAKGLAAVLRELADEHTSRDGNWLAIPPPTVRQLADSIERDASDE